jgi:uncharacterized protein (TIGR03435 family)
MIRQLLADRFTLTFHRAPRELPVYGPVVASGGPKLAPNDSNLDGLPSLLFKGFGVLPAVNVTMGDLAGVMQSAGTLHGVPGAAGTSLEPARAPVEVLVIATVEKQSEH